MADERLQMTVKVLVVVVMVVLTGCTATLSPVPPHPTPPLADTSLCPATDTLALCELKLAECSGASHLLTPPSGLAHAALVCANTTAHPPTHAFLAALRNAVLQGQPGAFLNPTASSASLRQCLLNATGLLDPTSLTLNRSAVASRVEDQLPPLPPLAAAVTTCPEPVDFDPMPFLTCIKRACMSSVGESPEMTMVQAWLGSQTSPAASKAIPKPPAVFAP